MTMKQTGLTLIELIVTLAVVSVLLVLGIPQFKSTTANSRLTTAANTLTGDLAFARTEAIKRATAVTVTAPTNDWSDGWNTFINISGAPNIELRFSPALVADTAINTSGVNTIQFNSDGRSTSGVTFNICDDRSGTFGKKIDLTTTGQTHLTTKVQCN